MKCWHCNTELIWGSDFDGEDYGCEEEYCNSHQFDHVQNVTLFVEVYLPK